MMRPQSRLEKTLLWILRGVLLALVIGNWWTGMYFGLILLALPLVVVWRLGFEKTPCDFGKATRRKAATTRRDFFLALWACTTPLVVWTVLTALRIWFNHYGWRSGHLIHYGVPILPWTEAMSQNALVGRTVAAFWWSMQVDILLIVLASTWLIPVLALLAIEASDGIKSVESGSVLMLQNKLNRLRVLLAVAGLTCVPVWLACDSLHSFPKLALDYTWYPASLVALQLLTFYFVSLSLGLVVTDIKWSLASSYFSILVIILLTSRLSAMIPSPSHISETFGYPTGGSVLEYVLLAAVYIVLLLFAWLVTWRKLRLPRSSVSPASSERAVGTGI